MGWYTRLLRVTLALLAAAAPARAAEVVSGPLRAEIGEQRWTLAFEGPGGVRLQQVQESASTGPTGTLGFRTATGWHHSTHVLSFRRTGTAVEANLATTDPTRRMRVRVEPAGEGVIGVDAQVTGGAVQSTGIAFLSDPGERYLGFGERANAVDQRGNTVEHYVSDGPWQPEERPFMYGFLPPWGHGTREDSTYFPMPWLLSTRGYGVLIDNDERSRHRLNSAHAGAWSMEVDAARLRFRVFAGPEPGDVLRRLTEATGRQPAPAAPWQLGAWFHTGQENQPPLEREQQIVQTLRSAGAPVSAVETHMRYLPCGAAVGKREAERRRTAFFHEQGLATLTYFNSEICTDYQPAYDRAVAADVLQETADGDPYVFLAYVGDRVPPQTPIAQVDFTAPGAREYYGSLLAEAVEDGHDGWMEDFGEYTPPDSHAANGETGETMHNSFPVHYHRAAHEFAQAQGRPLVRHIRSGWTGVHPYAQVVWGGDPTTDWGYDGLRSVLKNGLSMGLSGISSWGSDIGGFFSLGFRELTPELLVRWIQVGAVSGVMRTKAAGVAVPPKGERPQVWDDEVLPHWVRYARLRTSLYPYLEASAAEYGRTGLPIMRHLALAAPGDPKAIEREDEFMFGPDILAAPVLYPGRERRSLYLPAGRWVRLDLDLRDVTGPLLQGGRHITVDAPLGELPLFVRAGAVLPLLPPDVDTLADYGGSELVRLSERGGRRLLAFPRGRHTSRMGEHGRLTSVRRGGRWTLRIADRRARRYDVTAALSSRPCAVTLGRRALRRSAWSWEDGVLRARLRIRRGLLRVETRC